jgi:hypothetical protein
MDHHLLEVDYCSFVNDMSGEWFRVQKLVVQREISLHLHSLIYLVEA